MLLEDAKHLAIALRFKRIDASTLTPELVRDAYDTLRNETPIHLATNAQLLSINALWTWLETRKDT